jgi:hypothetical protein
MAVTKPRDSSTSKKPSTTSQKFTKSSDGMDSSETPTGPKQFVIPNKMKRAEVFAKQKYQQMKEKKKLRLKRKKLEEKNPELKEVCPP